MATYPARTQKALERARSLADRGRLPEAIDALEKVVSKVPKGEEAWLLLGTAHSRLGRHDRALQAFGRARQVNPSNAVTCFNLGVANSALGRQRDAIAAYGAALELTHGNYPDALRNLAWCCLQLDDLVPARMACEAFAEDFGERADVLTLLGVACQGLQDTAAAVRAYRRALELGARDAMLHLNLGSCLHVLEDFAGAAEQARLAELAAPGTAVARLNRGLAQIQLGQIEPAIDTLASCPLAEAATARLAALCYLDPFDPDRLLAAHRAWGEQAVAAVPEFTPRRPAATGRKLRLGFISPDFRAHPVAYFVEGLLQAIDRSRFECVLYHDAPNRDAVTDRFRALADRWIDLHPAREPAAAADRIRGDQLDIVFDLAGTTSDRIALFARRLAPVQASYLGSGVTTGLPTMDFYVTDERLDPPGLSEGNYVEALIRLGGCLATYTPPDDAPTPRPRSRSGAAPVLASVARLNKISDATLQLWSRAMAAVPAARLRVIAKGLQNDATRAAFVARCAAAGIPPERIKAEGAMPLDAYLALHDDIDLFLDTTPWSGHTTTLHGLWMGVATATPEQPHHLGRFSAMVLHNAGLGQFVAATDTDFGAHVKSLLDDPTLLRLVREQGRQRVAESALTDHAALARRFESACRTMWLSRTGESLPE